MFDQFDQVLCRKLADRLRVLAYRRKLGHDVPSDPDPVVSRYRDILRYAQSPFPDRVHAAESGEILISHETYSLVKDVIMCRDKGQIAVKGFTRPVQIYQVVDFRRDLGATSSYVEHELPGFSMYLDTNGIQNFDKERVIQALNQAAEKLRDKVIL